MTGLCCKECDAVAGKAIRSNREEGRGGGGWSERDGATKLVILNLDRTMGNHEMNQHVTGRNLTRAHILCDPAAIRSLNLQTLETDCNQITVVTTGSQFAAQL